MKKILIPAISLLLLHLGAFAQNKAVGKATFNTPQVQCEEGKIFLEERMIHETGITSVNANFQRKTTTVTWLTDRTTAENIKVIFSYLGFDADDVTADEIAFKRIPPCCKKAPPAPKVVPKADTVKPAPVVVKPEIIKPAPLILKVDTPKSKALVTPAKAKQKKQ